MTHLPVKNTLLYFCILITNTACNPLKTITSLPAIPLENVVMFDEYGKPLNPTSNVNCCESIDHQKTDSKFEKYHSDFPLINYPKENPQEYEIHLKKIIDNLTEFDKTITNNDGKKVKRIMLFIHGGLNTQLDSVERIVEPFEDGVCSPESNCKPRFVRIKDEAFFPVFINWKSSLISSYWGNLFHLRQGKSVPWSAPFTSPFVLATDLGRSLLRWPIVSINLITNDITTIPFNRKNNDLPSEASKELLCRHYYINNPNYGNICLDDDIGLKFRKAPFPCPFDLTGNKGNNTPPPEAWDHDTINANNSIADSKKTFTIRVGDDERECSQMLLKFAAYIPTFPAKLFTTPVVDTFGTSSWDMMLRHTDLLFQTEDELDDSKLTQYARDKHTLANIPKHGGLALLLQKLSEKIKSDKSIDWEITLVGHSMGTIVANQLIRQFGDQLPIKNIIYLAAAISIHDYEDTIYPYLEKDQNRKIYHFMLHPNAESEESMGLELASRGSLLVWIDNFLSKPLSPLDRTVGRYINLLPALHNANESIRDQIFVRIYRAGVNSQNSDPQTHSDVAARFQFWKQKCWHPFTKEQCIIPE